MLRAEAARLPLFCVALLAALVAATCSRNGRLEPRQPVARARPAPAVVASAAPSAGAAPPTPAASLPEAFELPRAFRALSELEKKARRKSVRILWLGDSHTAADYLTGALRRRLEARFGPGGPGLVRLGASPYRHDGVKVVREGRFRIEPEPPSSRSREGDTALGFFGLRTLPSDGHARAEARIDEHRVKGTVRYDLLYDLPAGASFRVTLGTSRTTVQKDSARLLLPGSPINHLSFEAPARDGFAVDLVTGAPRFYGVIAEGSEPGIVLDTSGIDGARVATALAWNADVLAAELAARPPELFVLAYGTNEAFDNRRAEATGAELEELATRIRRGAPDADCLVVGPPDAATPELQSLPRVAEIEAAERVAALRMGCAFFSLRAAMGGDGGFARFLGETPALARSDRVHLTPGGYARLGDALADELLAAYERRARP